MAGLIRWEALTVERFSRDSFSATLIRTMSYYTPFIPSVWRKDLAEGSIRELSSNHVPEDCSEAGFQALVYFQGVHPLRVTTVTHHETQELVLRQERGFGVKDVERGKFVESAVGLLLEDLHLTVGALFLPLGSES